jgi:hypothetical protein
MPIMKYLMIALIAAVACTSCKKKSNNQINQYSSTATYYDKTAVNTAQPEYLFDTTMHTRLFHYVYGSNLGDPNKAKAMHLVFDTPDSAISFSFSGIELAAHHTYFTAYNGLSSAASIPVEEGTITGKLQRDSSWQLTISVRYPGGETFNGGNGRLDTIDAHAISYEQMVFGRLY